MNKKEDKLLAMRHTAEHVLHTAMQELYPSLKKAMGPATEDGFYFDFDLDQKITPEDFPKIEAKMQEIIDADLPLQQKNLSEEEAREIFKDNPYKLDWIDLILERGEKISSYSMGDRDLDICSGPHAKSSGAVKAFKLLSVAGAYWHGDEKNKMLARIYGTAFDNQKELDEHLERIEEAKKRDHRRIGKDLDLFTFSDLVGKGLPLFTEKGATIWREIERYVVDEEIRHGYQHVRTPNIAKTELYKTSGHYPYYKDTMYPPMKVDEDELILRPMTCPHHFALYLSKPRSYRELPLRFAEMASLYRYEKSGELTGLLRVREFCLADSHNFVRKEQAGDEIRFVLELIREVTKAVGLQEGEHYTYRLSLGDRENKEKYYDAPQEWEEAEKILRQVLKGMKVEYYEAKDEAAFYGPKIDIQMFNVMGKEDTAFTVQYDFCLPSRFNLRFINEDGQEEQPIVVHRSSIGALERTIGFLIEHYAGAFPVWLSPEQVYVLPIGEKHHKYAQQICDQLKEKNVRVVLNDDNETIGKKIREAETQRVPYSIIVGDNEIKDKKISVRSRDEGDLGVMDLSKFTDRIVDEINNKS